jgi:predicted  nucleic acid-binding Zn-ribbon protein
MTSTKIIAELKALEKRRAEVAAEAEVASAALAAAKDGLLEGIVQVGDITSTHSADVALQSVLSSLDGKIAEAQADLRAAQATEEAEALSARVSALAAEARAVKEEHFTVSREAQAALSVAAGKMLDLRARYDDLSREVRDISGEGLGTPEWQRCETQFAPLVLQAALLLAEERERMNRKSRPPTQAPAHHVPLARGGDGAIQTRPADEAASD